MVDVAHGWGEQRVYCDDGRRRFIAFPINWTDRRPPDPYRAINGGRAPFAVGDLLELADLLEEILDSRESVE